MDGRTSWCKECRQTSDKARNRKNILKRCADQQLRNKKNRLKLLALYGGRCECPGCCETAFEFLAIDHIRGGGCKERKQLKGYAFCNKLLKEGKRLPDYRILCHNCNFALGKYGYCPYQKSKTTL